MVEAPYTPLTGKIKSYFDKIMEVGVPEKANRDWLITLGFRSGNDVYILSILKYIGFTDSSNIPTEMWKNYRSPSESGAILAQAIKNGYSELFQTYSDAYNKDRNTLYSFFSGKSAKAELTINQIVSTFINLCKLADFEKIPSPSVTKSIEEGKVPVTTKRESQPALREIHINIQLHLPATNDSSVYDRIFESLKKHLMTDEK